jgi:hypothetical protein
MTSEWVADRPVTKVKVYKLKGASTSWARAVRLLVIKRSVLLCNLDLTASLHLHCPALITCPTKKKNLSLFWDIHTYTTYLYLLLWLHVFKLLSTIMHTAHTFAQRWKESNSDSFGLSSRSVLNHLSPVTALLLQTCLVSSSFLFHLKKIIIEQWPVPYLHLSDLPWFRSFTKILDCLESVSTFWNTISHTHTYTHSYLLFVNKNRKNDMISS